MSSDRMFDLGESYTREQIHAFLGGGLQTYLPHVGGRVVAACLRLDTNPDAPNIILPGTGKGIEYAAQLLVSQRFPVPIFVKRGTGRWEYVGEFVPLRWSRESTEITEQAQRSKRS